MKFSWQQSIAIILEYWSKIWHFSCQITMAVKKKNRCNFAKNLKIGFEAHLSYDGNALKKLYAVKTH